MKTPAARARKLRAKKARKARKNKGQTSERSKKWFFGTGPISAGPVNFGGMNMGSGSAPSGRGSRSMLNDTVGVAPRSRNVQVVLPRLSTELGGRYGATDVLKGTEFLKSVGTDSLGTQPGDILAMVMINPSKFVKTRLLQFAALYQRYRFRKVRFIYEPIANATVSGQLIGFGDYDVDNLLLSDTPDNIRIAAAHIGQQICQLWEGRDFPFGVLDDFTTLFTSLAEAEARLIYQGVFYLIASSVIENDLACGNLYIEYEIEFNIPILAESDVTDFQALQLKSVGGTSDSLPLGTAPIVDPTFGLLSNLVYSYDPGTGTVTLTAAPLGQYIVSCEGTGGGWISGVGLTSNVAMNGTVTGPNTMVRMTAGMMNISGNAPTNVGTEGDSSEGLFLLTVVSNPVILDFAIAQTDGTTTNVTAGQVKIYSLGNLSAFVAQRKSRYVDDVLMQHGRVLKNKQDADASEGELDVVKDAVQNLLAQVNQMKLEIAEKELAKQVDHEWISQTNQLSDDVCSEEEESLNRARVLSLYDRKGKWRETPIPE